MASPSVLRNRLTLFFLAILAVGGVARCKDRAHPPKNEFVIGCITPLTGDGASYGHQTKQGIDLAIDELNSHPVDGRKFRVVYEDDQMRPQVATSALQKLVSIDKVPAVIGAFGSSVTLAIAPIAEREKTVLISASSTADKIRDAGDYIFRNVPPNAAQARTAADFCSSPLQAKRVAILYMNNDYGLSLRDEFLRRAAQKGLSVAKTEAYNPGARDFRSQLLKIREAKPDVVYFPGHYQESSLILRQARELGVQATFVGGDGSYAPNLIEVAGEAAEGSYYTIMAMGYGVSDQAIADFTQAFRTKYKEEPNVYSAYAYDAMLLLGDAIRRGGYTSNGIKAALYSTEGFSGVTGITRFDKNGEVDKPFYVYEVKNGAFQRVSFGGADHAQTQTAADQPTNHR